MTTTTPAMATVTGMATAPRPNLPPKRSPVGTLTVTAGTLTVVAAALERS